MENLTDEKPLLHHEQILDDHAEKDAAMKRWENDDRWIGWFIKNLADALRRMGYKK